MDSSSMSERIPLIPLTAVKDLLVVLVEDMLGLYGVAKVKSSVYGQGIPVKLNSSRMQALY